MTNSTRQVYSRFSGRLGETVAASIQSRHPARTLSAAELDSLTGEHLRGISVDEYGVWTCYPWSSRLVHLLGEREFAELRTNHNRYMPESERGINC
jgi:hypothetical protein